MGTTINYPPCISDWHFNKCSPDSHWNHTPYTGPCEPWLDGGCSYILSNKAHQKLIENFNQNGLEEIRKNHIYEDLMVGLILKE